MSRNLAKWMRKRKVNAMSECIALHLQFLGGIKSHRDPCAGWISVLEHGSELLIE